MCLRSQWLRRHDYTDTIVSVVIYYKETVVSVVIDIGRRVSIVNDSADIVSEYTDYTDQRPTGN